MSEQTLHERNADLVPCVTPAEDVHKNFLVIKSHFGPGPGPSQNAECCYVKNFHSRLHGKEHKRDAEEGATCVATSALY